MTTAAGTLRSFLGGRPRARRSWDRAAPLLGWRRPRSALDWAGQGLVAVIVLGCLATLPLMSSATVLALLAAGALVIWTTRHRPVLAGVAAVATLGVTSPAVVVLLAGAEADVSGGLTGLSLLVPACGLLMDLVRQRNAVATALVVYAAELLALAVAATAPSVFPAAASLATLAGLTALWAGRKRYRVVWLGLDVDVDGTLWADHGRRELPDGSPLIVSGKGWVLVITEAPRRRIRRPELAAAASAGHTVAQTVGAPPDRVQPVVLSRTPGAQRRVHVPGALGGVVTILPRDRLHRLLGDIPVKSDLSKRVRDRIERLDQVQPAEVAS